MPRAAQAAFVIHTVLLFEMNATLKPQAQACDTERHRKPLALDSLDLLRGHKSVVIQHNGVHYRLQATKLGKLILTK